MSSQTGILKFFNDHREVFSQKVNSYSNLQENSKEKLIQKKIIEFIKETENNQEDIFSKLETDYSEFYKWEDYGFVTEELYESYSTKEEYGTVYPPDLQGKLLSKEAQKTISKASKNMQELVFDEDLSPTELRRRAILKLLYDQDFLQSLGLDLNSKVKTIIKKINEKINEGVAEENRREIHTDLNELTDADVMDIARLKFNWGAWKTGNVAYLIFKIKSTDGTKVRTGIIFAKSGVQEMLGVFSGERNYKTEYIEHIFESNKEMYKILYPFAESYEDLQDGFISRGFDSEAKLCLTLLDMLRTKWNDFGELELTFSSERGFCKYCDPAINNLMNNLIENIINRDENSKVILRLRNDRGQKYGVKTSDFNYQFLDTNNYYAILLYNKYKVLG